MSSDDEIRTVLQDALGPHGDFVAEPDAGARLVRLGRQRVRRRRLTAACGIVAVVAAVGAVVGTTGALGSGERQGAPVPPATGSSPSHAPVVGPTVSPGGRQSPPSPAPTASGPAAGPCAPAPFMLGPPPADTGLSVTKVAAAGAYRTLKPGDSVAVATGPSGASVTLARGVPDTDFAVSVYAHGPEPLQDATVLGSATALYPAADTGAAGPRIPFGTGSDRATNACHRWELRATGLTDQQLTDYALGVQPTVAFSTGTCPAGSLSLRLARSGYALSHLGLLFVLTNGGSAPCILDGYPTVRLAWRGSAVATDVTYGSGYIYRDPGPAQVRLAPGGTASFGVTLAPGAPNRPCVNADSIRVTPPGGSTVHVGVDVGGCLAGNAAVTALVAGSAGPKP